MEPTPLPLPFSERSSWWALLTLICLALSLPGPALAGIVMPSPDPDAPNEPDRVPLTLISQEVDVSIIDQVATTTLVQVFRNDGDEPVAGTYLLPLSEQASVQEYAFWFEGRRYASSLKVKEEAKEDFEQAEARGESAALLESSDPYTFTARFTELAPGDVRRFEVIYSEILPYEAGIVRYSHPLRYDQLGLPPIEELRIHVEINDGKTISGVRSSSWPLKLSERGATRYADLRLRDTLPAGDFELEYELSSKDFGLTFRTYDDGDGEGFFVAMIAPQEQTTDEQIVRKDVAFVFDTSGSMGGAKIDQARQALKACLNLMNPGDGVYLLAFSDALNPWKTRSEQMEEGARISATDFVDGLSAGGGTNIYDAVQAGLSVLSKSERPTALVFLTDGLGSRSTEDTLQGVRGANEGGKTRIFTFGVGEDVNQAFLERLGNENRGGFTHIRGDLAIDVAVRDFYSSISKPVLTDLSLDFGGVTPNRVYPTITPDVYKGQRLVMTGRYRGAADTTLTVTGRIGGEERTLELPVRFGQGDDEHPWVARLWAKRRAEHLLSQIRMYGETPEFKDEVIALSTEYCFASPYTSLVARVDPRVASLTPARIKPGDPEIFIPAPPDAIAVTAFLPFGEVKDLVSDPRSGLWTTRFLVPRSVEDGVYWIHVLVTHQDGESSWFRISYTVDTLAPVMIVELDREGDYEPGDIVSIEGRPTVGFLELGEQMIRALGRDVAARAKAFADVKRVVARLANTRLETELRTVGLGELGWHGEIVLPRQLAPGEYRLEVTATDVAGNRHTVVREITVRGDATAGLVR